MNTAPPLPAHPGQASASSSSSGTGAGAPSLKRPRRDSFDSLGRAVQANQAHILLQQQAGVHGAGAGHHQRSGSGNQAHLLQQMSLQQQQRNMQQYSASSSPPSASSSTPVSPMRARPAQSSMMHAGVPMASFPSASLHPPAHSFNGGSGVHHHHSTFNHAHSSFNNHNNHNHNHHGIGSSVHSSFSGSGLGGGGGGGGHGGHGGGDRNDLPLRPPPPQVFPFPDLLTLNRSRLLHLLDYQIRLSTLPVAPTGASKQQLQQHQMQMQQLQQQVPGAGDVDSAAHYAVLAAAVRLLHLQGCVHNFSFVSGSSIADELMHLRRPHSGEMQLHFSGASGFFSASSSADDAAGLKATRLSAIHLLEVLAEIRNSPSPVLAPPSELPPQLLDRGVFYRPVDEPLLGGGVGAGAGAAAGLLGLPAHSLQLSPYVYHRVLALLSFLLNLHLHQLTLSRILLLLQGIDKHLNYWTRHQDISSLPRAYRLYKYVRFKMAGGGSGKKGKAASAAGPAGAAASSKLNPYRNWSAMAARNVRELSALKNLWTTRCGRICIRMHRIQDWLRDSFSKTASVPPAPSASASSSSTRRVPVSTAAPAPLFHHQIALNSRYFAKLYFYVCREEMTQPASAGDAAHDEHELYGASSASSSSSTHASANTSSNGGSIESKILALHSQFAFFDAFLVCLESRFSSWFESEIDARRKPHHLFEYWHWYAATIGVVGATATFVYRNQDLVVSTARDFREAIGDFMTEHAWEPLHNIYTTVFSTFRDRSLFSTNVKSLNQSKQNLSEMLASFANNHASELSQHEQLDLDTYRASIAPRAKAGDMNLVMKTYEREIEKPISSLFFGDLAHGILIQVQKAKVDTEAAMLAADQLLQSNEINFNLTATIPVLMLSYFVGDFLNKFVLRGSWTSKKVRDKVKQSRNILSELEQLYILHLQGVTGPASTTAHKTSSRAKRPHPHAQFASLRLGDLPSFSGQEAEAEDEALRARAAAGAGTGKPGAVGAMSPAEGDAALGNGAGAAGVGSRLGGEVFGRMDGTGNGGNEDLDGAISADQEESEEEGEDEDEPSTTAATSATNNNGHTLFPPTSPSASSASSSSSSAVSPLGLSNHAYGHTLVLIYQLSTLFASLPLSSAFSSSSLLSSSTSVESDPRLIVHKDLILLASHQLTPDQKLKWIVHMERAYDFLKA